MSIFDILSMYPNILKQIKVLEYQFNEVSYYGSGNASGRLRFTNNHNPNKTYVSLEYFIKLLANIFLVKNKRC